MKENIEYSEILEILGYMDKQYVEKLPKKLIELFENNSFKNYKPHIDFEVPLSEQYINSNTTAILALMYLDYWCEDDNEKQELIKLYDNNETIYQKELSEKYNPDNLFKKQEGQQIVNETSLIKYKDENILKKILNKILGFFKKN